MKTIEEIRASILEVMIAGTDEPENLSKSSEEALSEAVQNYLIASTATASEPAWTDPTPVDIFCPHGEARSKASGLTPPR